jgi:radical SAM superfamily enzyme YgiQ (UPF0313 family)
VKRVLLLNPPADPPVSRDYYCGHFTKGRYYWPPLDLVVLSGILSVDFEVLVLDAVAEGLDTDAAQARAVELNPDAVIAVTASVSWSSDMAFLSKLKEHLKIPVLISGDYPRAEPEAVIKGNACVDAVILNFVENDVCALLRGDAESGLRNLYTRNDSGEPEYEDSGAFSYPVPRHELFSLKRYSMPQSLHHPAATILTDFGCPFSCDFCFMERLKHRRRDICNVSEELARLAQLGIRELFLADQSFGSHREHALEVCQAIQETGKGKFTWTASMRVDAADKELLQAMRAAGCHTLMFGVETPTQEVLEAHRKQATTKQVEGAFLLAKKMGFRTLAHLILGLTGEDDDSTKRIVEFAVKLDPDIASFNVAAPAWNTSFGDEVRSKSWMLGEGVQIADENGAPVWERPGLSRDAVLKIRDQAMRRFYMRPSYIIRQLLRVRSAYQLRVLFREGIGILKNRTTS